MRATKYFLGEKSFKNSLASAEMEIRKGYGSASRTTKETLSTTPFDVGPGSGRWIESGLGLVGTDWKNDVR